MQRRIPEPVMFALVAAATTLLDVLLFWVLIDGGVHPLLANVASYGSVSVINYALNGRLTFARRGAASAGLGSLRRMAAFAVVKLATLAVSTAALAAALVWLPPLAAKGASIVVTFGVSFLLSSRLVFVARAARPPMS